MEFYPNKVSINDPQKVAFGSQVRTKPDIEAAIVQDKFCYLISYLYDIVSY